MKAISTLIKLRENCNYVKRADSHKEQFGENQISTSCFVNF